MGYPEHEKKRQENKEREEMLTQPPYNDIGNPKLRINPFYESAYDRLVPELKVIAEIFDLSDFDFVPGKILVLYGPWYWITI